jgi:hypothetical protein
MFDYHVFKKGTKLPATGDYFVLAANGAWVHNQGKILRSLIKADKVPGLEEGRFLVEWLLPKLPKEIVTRCLLFFRRVYHEYKSESALTLYVNPDTKEFQLYCPRQVVSHGGVDYRRIEGYDEMRKQGFLLCGTVHSHCDFGAFHSGTDTNDEVKYQGMHMTIGHVDHDRFSVVTSLVVNEDRKQIDPLTIVEGITPAAFPLSRFPLFQAKDEGFRLTMSDQEVTDLLDKHLDEIETKWMPKVAESRSYSSYSGKGRSMGFQSGKGCFKERWLNGEIPADEVELVDEPPKKLILPPVPSYGKPIVAEVVSEPQPPALVLASSPSEVLIQGQPVQQLPQTSRTQRKKARRAAMSLLSSMGNLAAEQYERYAKVLKDFFGKSEITDADIKLAAGVKEEDDGNESSEVQGQPAVQPGGPNPAEQQPAPVQAESAQATQG